MIAAQLIGGLGNQLFQYAAARRLAYIHNTALKLDLSAFETYKLHSYHLNHLNIEEAIASEGDFAGIGNIEFSSSGDNSPQAMRVVKERSFNFDPGILDLPDNVWLIGYWQSEKYFSDIRDILMQEFKVKHEPDARNKDLMNCIAGCNSVALHVRRGDYINNPHTYSVHGTCNIEYYRECITQMSEKVSRPHYFIFSDDPEWVKQNFGFLRHPATIIDHNGPEKDYEDLRLMTKCRHHIIANSTFSWWGAWLNPNPEKLVYTPVKWFNKQAATNDLIPAAWFRI